MSDRNLWQERRASCEERRTLLGSKLFQVVSLDLVDAVIDAPVYLLGKRALMLGPNFNWNRTLTAMGYADFEVAILFPCAAGYCPHLSQDVLV